MMQRQTAYHVEQANTLTLSELHLLASVQTVLLENMRKRFPIKLSPVA